MSLPHEESSALLYATMTQGSHGVALPQSQPLGALHPTAPWNHLDAKGASQLDPESATVGNPIRRVPTEGSPY